MWMFLLGFLAGALIVGLFCRREIKQLRYYYEAERYFSRQYETYN